MEKKSLKHFVETVNVPVDLGPFTVNVVIDPDPLSLEHFDKLQGIQSTDDFDAETVNTMVDLCVDMIISWDLLENDEKTVVPITRERLRQLKAHRVLLPIISAVMEAANPTKGEAAD